MAGIQRIEQPEQGHIGNGEVGHALVALAAHAHQPLALGRQLGQQVFEHRQQAGVAIEAEQGRDEIAIQLPTALGRAHQPRQRAGQVVGVVVTVQPQAERVFQHADRLHFIAIQVLYFTPDLAVALRAVCPALGEQAVVAIGLLQRQRQQHHHALHLVRQQARQFKGAGQLIELAGIDRSAVSQAKAQPGGLELAQAQRILVKADRLHTPRVCERQLSAEARGPRLIAALLLELLRGQQRPRSPQGAVNIHVHDSCCRAQALALGI